MIVDVFGFLDIVKPESTEILDKLFCTELSNFDFYNLSFLTKISLIVFMIIGRIELLSILIL